MTTEERLEKLETQLERMKRHRKWLIGGFLTAVAVCGLGVWATLYVPRTYAQAEGADNTVSATKFVLLDAKGKPCGGLGAVEAGAALFLLDRNGKPRVNLHLVEGIGPALDLFDDNGINRASISVNKTGPAVGLFDDKGKHRASLVLMEAGPALVLTDEKGKWLNAMTAAGVLKP